MMSLGRVDLNRECAGIAVTGADTIKLLQSIVTCDMQSLTSERSILGSFPNPKGRVITLFRAIAIEAGCVLVVPRAMAERTLAHLQMYKFRSKAEFRILDASDALCGVMGAEARGWIAARFQVAPDEAGGCVESSGVRAIRLHGAAPRYLAFGESAAVDELLRGLIEVEDGAEMWRRAEVEAGVPEIVPATSEAFLPQNLNLEALGALSFTKGCYPGQEVVARTQYLGSVKRRLMRGRLQAGVVEPGAALKAMRDGAECDGGKVLAAVEGRLLAVIPQELLEAGATFYTEMHPELAVEDWERL